VCISELRGLQNFQTKHPETVVVAMNVQEDENTPDAVTRLITRQKLDTLRIATGKQWQDKFGVSRQIPVTLVLDRGKVRVMHDAVMADPVSFLEADLKAIHDAGK
jgi:endonuclease/exonuclease/phosphatase (EEP) superfamily protein YafD